MQAAAPHRVDRRLAAILAADVAGYSRLMGRDEVGTLARLRAHRRELIDPKIAEHRGRIVKTTGDGILIEFASVVDAVRCAAETQRAMVDREHDQAEDRRIAFRVGINLGDVIVEDDDIFGDGVNVAARLEALAEPGGICISGVVRDQVRDKLDLTFEDMGEQSVKNIARPVHVYALGPAEVAATQLVAVQARPEPARRSTVRRHAVLAASLVALIGLGVWWVWPYAGSPTANPNNPSAAVISPAAPRLSIVVLPFLNLSHDPDQDDFVDSITDDLTTDLSRIPDSFVIARNTAFTYKGKAVDVKQIGHDLGVRYVLEGSVRRLGEQAQVNVQLIDAETGGHVWADRFDTDRTNLAKAQEEITSRLAETLHVALLQSASRQIAQEKNPDARDLIMRGWALWSSQPNSQASRQEVQRVFEQALQLDPGSVDARVGIAMVLSANVASVFSKSPEQDKARAQQLLVEALERNGDNVRAHAVMGMLRRYQNRLTESQIELERALALDRNYTGAMNQLGWTLVALGQPEAALPYFQKAIRLDPQSNGIYGNYAGLGVCHLLLGHVDDAVDALRRAHAANPRMWYVTLFLAAALGLREDTDEAKTALAEALKLKPQVNSLEKVHAVFPDYSNNHRVTALAEKTSDAGLRRAGLPDK
jgi:adenylate cyclase